MADFLTLLDLEARAGAATVRRLVDDDGDAILGVADLARMDLILIEAEGLVYSALLRAYANKATIVLLMLADGAALGQAAWIALELLSERRVEFSAADGWGAYRAQYERAMRFFDHLSKGRISSGAQEVVGSGSSVGGMLQPKPPAGTEGQFTFAPSRRSPTGRGGF